MCAITLIVMHTSAAMEVELFRKKALLLGGDAAKQQWTFINLQTTMVTRLYVP